MPGGADSFVLRWTIANTLALLFGYVLYTPIAHGIGGDHPGGMSGFQVFTHALALAVVAASVAAVQRKVLEPYVVVPRSRLPLAVIAFVAAFFAGSYQPWLGGPDWDILFGAVVLGSAAYFGLVPMRRHPWASIVALLAFPVACFLGQLIIFGIVLTVYSGVTPELQTNRILHSVYWISLGASMGVIGGPVGGLALRRLLAANHVASIASPTGSKAESTA